MEQRRLTSFSHGAGCGCKLGPADLETVLGTLSLPELGADVLVAADTGDDAAVVRLPDGQALVATRPPTRSPTCTRWARGRSSH
jgi:selenide, water dikinase